jgi:site-specific DNA-methyltransferase (adenine-specific)
MRGDVADAVWTDPPYGVSYVGKTKDALTIQNDALTPAGLRALLDAAFTQALRHTHHGAAWYVAAPAGPLHLVFGNALLDLGIYRQQIIWVKDVFVLGHADYHYRHEPIFYGYSPGYTGRRGRGGEGWYSDHAQDTVWDIPRPKRSEEHPTMKPVELVTRALTNSTPRGATVVDCFAGSGTTLIAAHINGRVARLIELGPNYCDVIARRWQLLTGELPTLERTGEPIDVVAAHVSP